MLSTFTDVKQKPLIQMNSGFFYGEKILQSLFKEK